MKRIIFTYGSIAGAIVVASLGIVMQIGADHGTAGMVAGYLSMLVAMSMVFMGIKQVRDKELGGVIRFPVALGVGLGIAGVACLFYVLAWEAYLFATDYRFMDDYVKGLLEAERAKGSSAAAIAKMASEMAEFSAQYGNPIFRMAITLAEIAPVGIVVTLVSSGLLRKSSFFPAKR